MMGRGMYITNTLSHTHTGKHKDETVIIETNTLTHTLR